MKVIDAGQAPEGLPGGEVHAQQRLPAEHAPAGAVAVDGQLTVAPQMTDAGQTHRVQGDHHTATAGGQHVVVVPAHLVDLAGDVEGHHDLASGALLMFKHQRHDRVDPLGERAVRAVGLEFIVLDEVDAAIQQFLHHLGGGIG